MGAPRREQNRILFLPRLRNRKETDRSLPKGISKEDPSAEHKRRSTNSAKPREAEMKPPQFNGDMSRKEGQVTPCRPSNKVLKTEGG